MPAHAAVSIDDNLSSCQTTVAFRTTDDETAGWIDQETSVAIEHLRRDDLLDDALDDDFGNFLVLHIVGMLVGDDDGVDAHRLVAIVLDGDLCLAVRAQPWNLAGLAG